MRGGNVAASLGRRREAHPLKSWTRTLNLDDAHTLLAIAHPGGSLSAWAEACHDHLPGLSLARRRELVRMLRDDFLDVAGDAIEPGLFLTTYLTSPARAQVDLVHAQWALSHPLSVLAADRLVAPALELGEPDIPLDDVERLVSEHLATSSAESRRKTRTVLLGALEGVGVLQTRGTGQHRSLRAARGAPHPVTFGYLVRRELTERGADGMMRSEAVESSLPVRLTRCTGDHAEACLQAVLDAGTLIVDGDEVRLAA